jgi:hypothetical protein
MRQLLSKDESVDISANLTRTSDVDILLSFMLHTLRNRSLLNLDATMDANRRARRSMSKIITKMPVVPRSLFLIGVAVSTGDHIDEERPGHIVKGDLQGSPVALKVSCKGRHNNVVSRLSVSPWHLSISFHAEYMSRCVDVAVSIMSFCYRS